MARRVGTIVDLVEVQLGGQRRFVLSLEEDERLIFLICDDEELQQRKAGDVISFLLEDELSPGTVKKIQPVLQENSRLGLGGNPPILTFFDQLERHFQGLTNESRRFLETIPDETEFGSSLDLCRLTIATSLNASKCGQYSEKIAIRKNSLADLCNLLDKFNAIEDSEQLGLNEKINTLLSNWFLILGSMSQYFYQLEKIVLGTEKNLISAEQRKQNGEEEIREEDRSKHFSVHIPGEKIVARVRKTCRYGQTAMLYRVGVVLLLKDRPSDFFEAALSAKQAEYDQVAARLNELIQEDRRLERELRDKHKEICSRIVLQDSKSKQRADNRFAEALFAIRPEFRTRLQRFKR
uniref:Uncharacterized protein n=1 Tax=Steinernema glaseri TaxID=37863 RepID=A0A1I7ZS09_9BILA